MEKTELIKVPASLAQSCVSYLVNQPYFQVSDMLDALKKSKLENDSIFISYDLLVNLCNYISKVNIVQIAANLQALAISHQEQASSN